MNYKVLMTATTLVCAVIIALVLYELLHVKQLAISSKVPAPTVQAKESVAVPTSASSPRATLGMHPLDFTHVYGTPVASTNRGLVLLYASADSRIEITSRMGIVVAILLTPYDGTSWNTQTAHNLLLTVLPADVQFVDEMTATSASLEKTIHIQETTTGDAVSAIYVSF